MALPPIQTLVGGKSEKLQENSALKRYLWLLNFQPQNNFKLSLFILGILYFFEVLFSKCKH